MRFLVDECTGPTVAEWLRNQKHEVFSVFEEARGMNIEFSDFLMAFPAGDFHVMLF